MKPDFTLSTQTIALTDLLRTASIGQVVSYARLSEAIGEDVTGARHHLYTAMKALHDEGMSFGVVRTEGVKRLTAHELPAIGDAALQHIRRTSKRTKRRLSIVNAMNDVPNEARVKINATVSQLGVIEMMSSSKTAKAVAALVEDRTLPPMKLLDALKA